VYRRDLDEGKKKEGAMPLRIGIFTVSCFHNLSNAPAIHAELKARMPQLFATGLWEIDVYALGLPFFFILFVRILELQHGIFPHTHTHTHTHTYTLIGRCLCVCVCIYIYQ